MAFCVKPSTVEGLGRITFSIAPRSGEFFSHGEGDQSQIYQIKAVVHRSGRSDDAGPSGDLYAIHFGSGEILPDHVRGLSRAGTA